MLKQLALFLLLLFQISLLSILVCSSLLCFVFRLTKQNSISCCICLSLKTRHLELFYKIIIQLFSIGIFLGLWSRGPPCNFTEQLFFLHSCAWLLSNILDKCDQKIRQVKNQIIKHQIWKKN